MGVLELVLVMELGVIGCVCWIFNVDFGYLAEILII